MRLIKNTTELIGIKDQNIIIFLLFFIFYFFENNFLYNKKTNRQRNIKQPSFVKNLFSVLSTNLTYVDEDR